MRKVNMENLLIDTNVLLDIALLREPYYHDSVQIMQLLKTKYRGYITATTITDIFYIVRNQRGYDYAVDVVRKIVSNKHLSILSVDERVIIRALELDITDFEDAVQAAVGEISGINWIVTRNCRDFQNSPVQAVTPTDFMNGNIKDINLSPL